MPTGFASWNIDFSVLPMFCLDEQMPWLHFFNLFSAYLNCCRFAATHLFLFATIIKMLRRYVDAIYTYSSYALWFISRDNLLISCFLSKCCRYSSIKRKIRVTASDLCSGAGEASSLQLSLTKCP